MSAEQVEFVRLTEVPVSLVVDLLNEPRNARHMPLSKNDFSVESAVAWVEAKDAQWPIHGYGPWAVLINGTFAGWGGFQREENGADFALVLAPEYWGHGGEITHTLLDRGFRELGLDAVLIALPYTRSADRAVGRFGFVFHGTVVYDGSTFRQYWLTRDGWRRARETNRNNLAEAAPIPHGPARAGGSASPQVDTRLAAETGT